ncbi:MAG: AAA family ATPase [Desulfurococcaceae archaeon]
MTVNNEVVIVKGYYENFLTSICEAFKTGRFLWGFKRESDLNTVLRNTKRLVAFYVVNHGFAMVARIGERVENTELFWPDELKENKVIYNYRFFLQPIKISKCFMNMIACTEEFKPSEDCFINAGAVQGFIASKCGIELRKATIQLGANVNVVRGCKAQKIIDYLEGNSTLVDFKLTSSEIMVKHGWDPLSKCKKFYMEVTGPPYPGHVGKCLWSPATGSYKYMENLEPEDCILHYLTLESPSTYKKMIVGVSRVNSRFIRLSKEELVKRLNTISVWSSEYAEFAEEWLEYPEYALFYFVELSNYIEFPRKISLDEFTELTGIKPTSLQKYLVELAPSHARKILEVALRKESDYTLRNLAGKLTSRGLSEFVILLHILSGKNILLVGPPGSGKTSLLKELLSALGVEYRLETGNPEWTPFDTIGGLLATGDVKEGFILDAVKKCRERLERDGKLYWLIIDEINRANVDLAFGKFFTLLDPIHREKEKLEIPGSGENSIEVPYVFRVLATMNNYDRALLFKLGYALTRRFAIINHSYIQAINKHYRKYVEKATSGKLLELLKQGPESIEKDIGVDFERIKEELKKCRGPDCITPLDFAEEISRLEEKLKEKWRDEVYSIEVPGGKVRLDNVAISLVKIINEDLDAFSDCEVCPIKITPGVVADALKYIAIGIYAFKKNLLVLPAGISETADLQRVAYILLLLDSAFSTYIVPQLDILADYASREKLQRGAAKATSTEERKSIVDILNDIRNKLIAYGLVYSASLVEKLSMGYHVF